MSAQERYAQLFAAEVGDRLSEIGRLLVELEDSPGDEALNEVFRSVHTIKGMAGAMGYDGVARVSHHMEGVLDELRNGRRRADPDVIDRLLAASDLLGQTIEATLGGGIVPDPSVLIEQLVTWRLSGDANGGGDSGLASTHESVGDAEARWGDDTPGLGAAAAFPAVQEASRSRPVLESNRVPVDITRLDELLNLIGELGVVAKRLRSAPELSGSEFLQGTVETASTLIAELQVQILESRLVPMWQLFGRFPRLVRDAGREAGKEVELRMIGRDLEADRSLLDAISDPLVHLLRNAVDHGIEPPDVREAAGKPRAGEIELSAWRERSRLMIAVRDDGRGVDEGAVMERARKDGLLEPDQVLAAGDLFKILARPGFSTVSGASLLSGRGVGLNVVEERVRGVGGAIELKSEPGRGSLVRLELPLTLAVVRALIVDVGGQTYAIPASFARESVIVAESEVERVDGREWVVWRGERTPLTRLQRLFAGAVPAGEDGGSVEAGEGGEVVGGRRLHVIVLQVGGSYRMVSVDALVGEEEVLVKSVDMPAGAIPVFSGATVRPDGRPALVLDVGSLA